MPEPAPSAMSHTVTDTASRASTDLPEIDPYVGAPFTALPAEPDAEALAKQPLLAILPFQGNIASPFSEAWGTRQLHTDMFRWHKRPDGRWMRGLWGGEMYQERRSAGTNRCVSYKITYAAPTI